MDDKLILLTYKDETTKQGGKMVRINNDTHKLLSNVSKKSNLPMHIVINRMLAFAVEHTEIKEI